MSLFYELTGTGETIVFIHGDTLDHRMWHPQVEYLRNDFQILTYDMPGFGRSPAIDHPFYQHEALKELVNQLKLNNFHLAGASYGGEIAVNFTLTYPTMVTSLILLDTAIGGFPCPVKWDIHIKEGLEATKQNWLNHEVFGSIRNKPEVRRFLEEMVKDYKGTDWYHPEYRKKMEPNPVTRLAEITAPVLAITGAEDLPYFQETADQLKIAERHYIQGAGHLPNLEQPEAVNRQLKSFLDRV